MTETPTQTPLPFTAEEAAVVKSLRDLTNLTTIDALTHTNDVLNHLAGYSTLPTMGFHILDSPAKTACCSRTVKQIA